MLLGWMGISVAMAGEIAGREGDARDSLKLKWEEPRLAVPEGVVLTDSIPGAFADKLDGLLERWYVRGMEKGDGKEIEEIRTGVSFPDSVYLGRLDSLRSAIRLSYNGIVRNYIELYTVKRREQAGFSGWFERLWGELNA